MKYITYFFLSFLILASTSFVEAQTYNFNDSDTSFSTTGSWNASSGSYLAAWEDDHHWANFADTVNNQAGTNSGHAKWTLSVDPGEYEVRVSYSVKSNRATDAMYSVVHDGGTDTFEIDQTATSGDVDSDGFVLLDTLCNPTEVTLSTDATQGSNGGGTFYGYVSADAVRLVRTGDCTPTAPDTTISTGPAMGTDAYITAMAQKRLFKPHANDCDSLTEAFVLIADNNGFCIEKTTRSSTTWEEARSDCLSDNKRLPEPGEFKIACNAAGTLGLSGMGSANEWASNFAIPFYVYNGSSNVFPGIVSSQAGGGGCSYGGYNYVLKGNGDDASKTYRCVR